MKINGVSSAILTTVRQGVLGQLAAVAKRRFDGANIQTVEKNFFETLGNSGATGLIELFACNDEPSQVITRDGEKHYRKFFALGRYLTLLGEISLKRGIYQSNKAKHSICPLEQKITFINNYVSFAATEYICYSMASHDPDGIGQTLREMDPDEAFPKGRSKRVLEYIGQFLEAHDFLDKVRSKQTVSEEAVTLAMSMDSTSILIKREGWQHAVAATVSTYDIQGDRLDTVYIGRMPEKGKTQAKGLLEKEVEALMAIHDFNHIVCIADGVPGVVAILPEIPQRDSCG